MKPAERIKPFIRLGEIMAEAASASPSSRRAIFLRDRMDSVVKRNRWFTPENVIMAVEAIAGVLTEEKIYRWIDPYDLSRKQKPLTIAVIMAGNIPLVGFHDLITVLLSGNKIKTRISSRDPQLMESIIEIITEEEPRFKSLIEITEKNPAGADAVIATGSDNTARYFEYHFGNTPHIFRKNRTSVAVLDNDITREELSLLGNDIFSFFGLGCRNVSRLLIPASFDAALLTGAWESHAHLAGHTGWQNNYIYEKARSMAGGHEFTDGGFFILRESAAVTSPLAVIHYERYQNPDSLRQIADRDREKIQTVVGKGFTPFGKAQFPGLWDYADNIDTMRFLTDLK